MLICVVRVCHEPCFIWFGPGREWTNRLLVCPALFVWSRPGARGSAPFAVALDEANTRRPTFGRGQIVRTEQGIVPALGRMGAGRLGRGYITCASVCLFGCRSGRV